MFVQFSVFNAVIIINISRPEETEPESLSIFLRVSIVLINVSPQLSLLLDMLWHNHAAIKSTNSRNQIQSYKTYFTRKTDNEMVSRVNIHSWKKLTKPCMVLKEPGFPVTFECSDPHGKCREVLFCRADLLPMWAKARSESMQAHCCLSQGFCEPLPCFWLGRPWKTKGRGNKCAFNQAIKSLRLAVLYRAQRGDPACDDTWTLCHCWESLPGAPCSSDWMHCQ